MTLLQCGDICPVPRRHLLKRLPYSSSMHPVTYADTGSAPVTSHYISYPLHTAFNVVPQKVSTSSGAVYPTNYVDEVSGLCASSPLSSFTTAYQHVQPPLPADGQTNALVVSPGEVSYVQPTHSASSNNRKPVAQQPSQYVRVPEPGTQSRGKLSGEPYRPRATTSPAAIAPNITTTSYQNDWEQEAKRLQHILNARENELDMKEAELQDALSKLQEHLKQEKVAQEATTQGTSEAALKEQEAELKTMRRRIEVLRHERQELMELLLQKERQATALNTIDPAAKEASAVQLGIQAISMVQGAAELRGKLELAEAEIKTLRAERAATDELQQHTFEKLTEKRKEAAELLELLSQRDMKVARIETYLQQKSRELDSLSTHAKERLKKEQQKREQAEQEYRVAVEQCNAFKTTLASRDERILQLQAEVVRRDTLLKQLEERVHVLSGDLTGAHSQLQQMLKAMAAKDAYMQELEAQLRKNDTERQLAYLTEVSKSRKLALDTRIQQELCRAAINDKREKLAEAKQDLFRSRTAMERIRKAIGCAETTENCYVRSEALQSNELHIHPVEPTQISPLASTGIPAVPVDESLRHMQADFLVLTPSPETRQKPATATKQPTASAKHPTSSNKFQVTSTAAQPTSKPPSSASRTSTPGYGLQSEQFCPPYTPVRDDPLDEAVAHLCELPEYRSLAAHICRLGPGSYLCCMNEVAMELQKNSTVWVKLPGGQRITLASYFDVLRSTLEACPGTAASGIPLSGTTKTGVQSKTKESS
ncbi:high molecular mass nuclear antigen, putative [Eimeria necatrix]|uniref:High molecular mass nuclear antigen, putative n=1 Tax=Eimeria necatrix TaxID=51315 RepID=U6N557_9EIME|nr:high molecular mass nuclear antigen, putative [Eimeria necatrix]CDJ69020.1 high molecular mass nuclear antigen, putative [Eimeria necatrix]